MRTSIARAVAALAAAAGACCPVAAAYASGTDTPAVDVVPVGTHPTDPNGGLWFVHRLGPGGHGQGAAMLINPASVPQVVHLYARALDFSPTGAASVDGDPRSGIATWVHFAQPTVTVPPSTRLRVTYDVDVPADADPGDHTGALIAESGPLSDGHVTVVKRIATRFYVTVPGAVVVAFRLDHLTHHVHSPLWPHAADIGLTVVNTGTTRFVPRVSVNGASASGSTLVLAHSIEPFAARLHVPWWGGHVRLRVVVTADGGHRQVLTRSFWVVPWLLIAVALVAIGGLVHLGWFVVRRVRRRRQAERALRERLAYLEQSLESPAPEASAVSSRGGQ